MNQLMMHNLDPIFESLQTSRFRQKFHLSEADKEYLNKKGLPTILSHGEDFIRKRLAPAHPVNDGKQTPMRNHPVFIAQHGTATCCRGCLDKWHGIPKGRELTMTEQRYVLAVIERWLKEQTNIL